MPATPSPLVLINSAPQINGVDVTPGSTVTVTLASNAGVYAWDVFCIGTDELSDAATVNASLNINHAINSATFTMPNYTGSALIFKSIVNNGVDINGVVQPGYTTTFGVYTTITNQTVDGYLRVGAQNETNEGDANYGWVSKFNPLFRKLPQVLVTQQITANTQSVSDGEYINANTLFAYANNEFTGGITIKLPNTPLSPSGTLFIIADVTNSASINPITIDPGGYLIDGSAAPYVINTNYGVVALISVDVYLVGWKILWEKV